MKLEYTSEQLYLQAPTHTHTPPSIHTASTILCIGPQRAGPCGPSALLHQGMRLAESRAQRLERT